MNKNNLSTWKIPLYKIYTDDEDIKILTQIVKRGTKWAIGPEIEEFENSIKNYVKSDYCVTLNSGTSSLHATFLASGFGKTDELIIPSFSFISTANAVLFVGANPIFSDIEEETFGLDPNLIQEKITSKTKAIVPMDYAGMSSKIFEINEIAKSNNLLVIEDAAEGLGSSVKQTKTGSNSDAAIFSFCGNKVLTTGEGGAVVTNSKELYEKIKSIRSHGRTDKINYFDNTSQSNYLELGYNWRMSSITAGLGISQIQKLDKLIGMRQRNAQYLSSHLSKFKEITLPIPPSGYEHIYQMYTIRLSNKQMRDQLHEYLIKKQIFSKIYFSPIHLTQFYREKLKINVKLPTTENISDQILTLPLYPNMTMDEKKYLVDSVAEFFEDK
jgi:perosamine synthetase